MRRPRVFSIEPLSTGALVELDDNAARHLVQVLRLKPGDPFILFDGSGYDYAAELNAAQRRGASARVGERIVEEAAPALRVHLAIGISRGERMDFSLQKAVELGVHSIAPLFTERSMVQLKGERLPKRQEHWEGVIRHACEQSGRSRIPQLYRAQALADWLAGCSGPGLLLDHRATRSLADLAPPGDTLSLLIGPEGGLSATERRQATQQGLQAVRMGPRILRTETAPLAALAAIQVLWGDFR